jgi:hypothetical protein
VRDIEVETFQNFSKSGQIRAYCYAIAIFHGFRTPQPVEAGNPARGRRLFSSSGNAAKIEWRRCSTFMSRTQR